MIGKLVSHYKILEKLGEGGMGVVYRAHDTKLDRDVALKFLPVTLNATPEDVARFEQEAHAISALNRASIATIFDLDETDGNRFLVLEFISGGTLKSKIRKLQAEDKEFPLHEVIEYGIEIADGLAHAHQRQIIHRDIKSDNIMLTGDGKVKITDFGLAKLRGQSHLTRSGSTLGTLAYMAPEQLRGEEIDHRADLFSFGVVLYEMATGRTPFHGVHDAALTYSIANEEPLPAKTLRQNLPPELDQIIAKALQKDRSHRYQNADEIKADLQKLQRESTGTVKTVVVEKRSKLPWMIAAAIVVLGAISLYVLMPPSHPTGANSKTIAVLPFTNLSGDKDEEYFSDGVTEDILTQLAQIADLSVISRTSSSQYKGTKKSIREIGKELNAGVVLEGSVRHAGDQVRIVAQLIDANNDKHVWAQTYDRRYREIFTIQSEIARSIAEALKARLSATEAEHLQTPARGNTQAYSLLLQGRSYALRRDAPNIAKAIALFQQALTIDSMDARVWAALSDAYSRQSTMSSGEIPADCMVRARNAALKSIALDDNLAEGHLRLGQILNAFDWDWQGANREVKKALSLEPSNSSVLSQMSFLSMTLGRFDEAIASATRAIEVDPVNEGNYFTLALAYMYNGRHRESNAFMQKALELNPTYPAAWNMISINYLALGMVDSATASARLESDDGWRLHALSLSYYASGKKEEAEHVLQELIGKSSEGMAFQIAENYAYRGDADRAFQWLEIARRQRDGGISQLLGDPLLKNIEHDPRYVPFLRKVGLTD
jgi:eukaryotic-like serine/threonine-protein kinase